MSQKSNDPAPSTPSQEAAPETSAGGLAAHKGKLAIGVAATLGLMIYYKWRERQLAKDDPEDYARLQRLKAGVTHKLDGEENGERSKKTRKGNSSD